MPDAENGCNDVNSVFHDNIFKKQKNRQKNEFTSAIFGAHTLGSAKPENSGYSGKWSTTEGVFNNDYYIGMLTKGWGPDLAVNGNAERNQWKRIDQGGEKDSAEEEMMLNSDLCLVY